MQIESKERYDEANSRYGNEAERTIILKEYSEYRIDVWPENKLEILLKEGTAEIYGAEMTKYVPYFLDDTKKVAIFSWHGCKLSVKQLKEGKGDSLDEMAYVIGFDPRENAMITFSNLHYDLNQQRMEAIQRQTLGPKVLVCGSASSGKNTLCKILLNYAVKTKWTPVFVDLDNNLNEIGTPGCMGAAVMQSWFPVDFLEEENKLIFFHGYRDNQQAGFYLNQVKNLLQLVNKKLENSLSEYQTKLGTLQKDFLSKELFTLPNNQVFASGVIVNTPSYSSFDVYKHIITSLDIDTIYVLDVDRLHQFLKSECSKLERRVRICNLSKSKGVVQLSLDSSYRKKLYEQKFLKYLHGENNYLKSQKYLISFDEVKIVKITKNPASLSMLPAGTGISDLEKPRIIKVLPPEEKKLNKYILGVTYCPYSKSLEENYEKFLESVIAAPLACIVYIEEVDHEKKLLTVLFPWSTGERMTNYYWLYSDLVL